MGKNTNKLLSKFLGFIGSRYFFWIVLALFVVQASWIAFSFKYPMIYDEVFHVPVTQLFTHQLSPVIVDQPRSFDSIGDLSHGGATLYHYLLSFPLRAIEFFTKSFNVQVVLLRLINIIMVASGLYVFSKLFKYIKIKNYAINIGLLIFIMLPVVPFVAAHVNYDNMLFLVTAWYLLVAVQILTDKKVYWQKYSLLIAVGCFASLVKLTFLPIFAVSFIYLAFIVLRRYKKSTPSLIMVSFHKSKTIVKASTLTVLIISTGLFATVYLQNVINYGALRPSCVKTLGMERCKSNGVVVRNLAAEATKDQRPVNPLAIFTLDWVKYMMDGLSLKSTNSHAVNNILRKPMTIIYNVIFFGAIVAVVLLVYKWGCIKNNKSLLFLLVISIVGVFSVFADNYLTYDKYHYMYSVQARYIMGALPVLIIIPVMFIAQIIKKYNSGVKTAILIALACLLLQGGGVTSYILRDTGHQYWNATAQKINNTAAHFLSRFINQN